VKHPVAQVNEAPRVSTLLPVDLGITGARAPKSNPLSPCLALCYIPAIMHLLRSLLTLSVAALGMFTFAQPAAEAPPPYQSAINSLADRLAHDIHSKHLKHRQSPKVVVTDFLNEENRANLLGQQIADALSAALQVRVPGDQLIPRKKYEDRLLAEEVSPRDLKNVEALRWYAGKAGANLVITGQFSAPHGNTTTLEIALTDINETKQVSSASADLALPPDGAKSLAEPADWPAQKVDALCRAGERHRETPGNAQPRCIYCPPPSYSEAARRNKAQARVVLRLEVDVAGIPTSAVVLSGAPYGLSEQAAEAVLHWRLSPATKENEPVPTCIQVEVSFAIH
jgi:protein TonB